MYVIKHGDVWVQSPPLNSADRFVNERHICGTSEELAILYDADNGVLYKHGRLENVRRIADEWRLRFETQSFQDIADALTVASFPANEEGCAFLNRCIENSGYVLSLIESGELPGLASEEREPASDTNDPSPSF